MIYPSGRTVLAAAAAVPAALVVGLFLPQYWTGGLGLLALLVALAAVDAVSGAGLRDVELTAEGPAAAEVGETFAVLLHLRFRRWPPRTVEAALAMAGPVEAPQGWRAEARIEAGGATAAIPLRAARRGSAVLGNAWLRWRGPFGLVWKQRQLGLGQEVAIVPDMHAVRAKSLQLVSRDSPHGLVPQLQIGEGAEFESLTEYRQGMDRRAIDWKQSARHTDLIAKEFRTERNNQVVVAIDSGRAMCEPLGGVPRIDRAVSAALLTAFVALKDGDRVGLFAFDSKPRASTAPVGGERAFALLQRVAAGIDYSARETNYTLAVATLAGALARRSLIVIFTEFADTISAELMLAALGPLLRRHLVLFVVMRDEELEGFAGAEPSEPEDVSRAVTAAGLLRERRLVLTRLRHLGAHVIEAPAEEAGPALVSAYLDFKRRSLL